MTTRLGQAPTLVERIVGAHLVVLGRVRGLREVRAADGFDERRSVALFDVDVDDVLLGRPPRRLVVRVLSAPDRTGKDEESWVVPMDPEVPVLLLLARDAGPDLPDDTYAPVEASVFPVEDGDAVIVAEDALDERTRERLGADDSGRVSLDSFRGLVDEVAKAIEQHRREVEELVPSHGKDVPYPPVLEWPGDETPLHAATPEPGPAGTPSEEDR
ncbi:hypothetical protein [Cellulomonas sp.]|uniref:hypothetical protein n=1 Tax=Cellulomonas sp. TaxID=40001 RepID=UPI003BAD70EF